MAVSLKHKFSTAKTDGPDTALVRPSNWNDEHDITLAASKLLGRATASNGAAEEVTVGTSLTLDPATQSLFRAALTGDVTAGSNSNATTIAAGAATLAKLDRTGSTGQVLTAQGSGNAPVWANSTSTYGGAQQSTITSDLVLTTSSSKVITVSSTNNADVQLPNATTYTQTGGELFKIYNVGYTILWIKDNGGRYLIGIKPGENASISLVLNTSSNGLWSINNTLIDHTVSKSGRFTVAKPSSYGTVIGAFAIGAFSETSVVLAYTYVRTSTTDVNPKFIVLATKTNNVWTFGTPVQVTALYATNELRIVMTSATTGLLAVPDTNITTGSRATHVFPFTLSGSTLSVGTSSNATSSYVRASNISTFIPIGTDALLIFEASTAGLSSYRIVRHNGTTVTLGTTLTPANTEVPFGTVVLSSTKFLVAQPGIVQNDYVGFRYYTVSGTTITAGAMVETTHELGEFFTEGFNGVISSSTEVIFSSRYASSSSFFASNDTMFIVNTSNATTPSVTAQKTLGYYPVTSAIRAFSNTDAVGIGGEKVSIVAGDGIYYSGQVPIVAQEKDNTTQFREFVKSSISPLSSSVIFVAQNLNGDDITFQAIYST